MLTGVVKWFNDAKGFGFIEHSSGQDVFVHYSVIEWDGFKTLKDGEHVNYELKEGEKGLHAARVLRPNAKMTEAEKAMKAAKTQAGTDPLSTQIEVENSQATDEPKGLFGKIAASTEKKQADTDFPEQ